MEIGLWVATMRGRWLAQQNPDLIIQLRVHASEIMEKQAKTLAERLDFNVSRERGERTGKKYPRLPARSSAAGEFPQEQFGVLRSSVGFMQSPNDMAAYRIGFFAALSSNPGLLKRYLAYIEGYPTGAIVTASRFPLQMTVTSPGAQEALNKNLRELY